MQAQEAWRYSNSQDQCHETLYTKPSFKNTALLAALPVYLTIYAFVHFCPLSVYACFAPSYMPGSHSHIYLFSIATHHALWFSVAIIALAHSTHTPTNNLNNRLEHVLNLNTPCLGIESNSACPSSFHSRPFPIPRRL